MTSASCSTKRACGPSRAVSGSRQTGPLGQQPRLRRIPGGQWRTRGHLLTTFCVQRRRWAIGQPGTRLSGSTGLANFPGLAGQSSYLPGGTVPRRVIGGCVNQIAQSLPPTPRSAGTTAVHNVGSEVLERNTPGSIDLPGQDCCVSAALSHQAVFGGWKLGSCDR